MKLLLDLSTLSKTSPENKTYSNLVYFMEATNSGWSPHPWQLLLHSQWPHEHLHRRNPWHQGSDGSDMFYWWICNQSFNGTPLREIYGKFQGFPLEIVHCVGWQYKYIILYYIYSDPWYGEEWWRNLWIRWVMCKYMFAYEEIFLRTREGHDFMIQ